MRKTTLFLILTPVIGSLMFLMSNTKAYSSVGGYNEITDSTWLGAVPSVACSMITGMSGCPATCPLTSGQSFTGTKPICGQIANAPNAEIREVLIRKSINESAMGQVNSYTVALYEEKPASAIAFFQDNWNKIKGDDGIVMAQDGDPAETASYRPGTGFSLLQPLSGLWAWSRNLTYLLFIVIAIVLSFAILFRKNLGGQAPITILNSIPSIILSLVFITFSYAISGLFIDVITVGSNLMQSILISGPGAPGTDIWKVRDGESFPGSGTWESTWAPEGQSRTRSGNQIQPDDKEFGVWNGLITSGVTLCSSGGQDCKLLSFIPENIQDGNPLAGFVETLVGVTNGISGGQLLINLIITFSTFMVSVKLFMLLLNKYVTLVLMVVVAPWYFFLGALPSKTESMFMLFIKIHLGAALNFVGIYGMFLLILVLGQSNDITNFTWIPPLMGYDQSFLQDSNIIRSLIILGTFLAIPVVPKFIDQLLEVPETNMVAKEIGSRVSGGAGALGGIATKGLSSINPQFAAMFGRR